MKEAIIKKFGVDLAQISQAELAACVQNLAFEQSLKTLRGLSEDAKSAKSAELILSFAAELTENQFAGMTFHRRNGEMRNLAVWKLVSISDF